MKLRFPGEPEDRTYYVRLRKKYGGGSADDGAVRGSEQKKLYAGRRKQKAEKRYKRVATDNCKYVS